MTDTGTTAIGTRPLALVTGASSGIGMALADQFAEHGYDILINADFFRRADMLDTAVGSDPADDPAQVAKQGFDALMEGKAKVIVGSVSTTAQGVAAKVLPDSVKASMHRSMAEPGSADR